MSDDRCMVDTNVLVYSLYETDDRYEACMSLLERGQAGDVPLCVSSQILVELYAVITDPRRVTSDFLPNEALEAVSGILAMTNLTRLATPPDLVSRWIRLVEAHPVTRGAIFDVQLVATMLAAGVRRIYTYDKNHFERFEEIEVLTP
jgi:predicted nucleic acid-binding protein